MLRSRTARVSTGRNKLTPRALATTLQKVKKEDWWPQFYASLPVAGNHQRMVGGTLRSRMDDDAYARNNARGKTGTLTGATALSGHVIGRDGRTYVYALISNYPGSTPRPVEDNSSSPWLCGAAIRQARRLRDG